MTRSQNSETIPPPEDINRLVRELRRIQRQQNMADDRDLPRGPLDLDQHGRDDRDEPRDPLQQGDGAQDLGLDIQQQQQQHQQQQHGEVVGEGDNRDLPLPRPINVVDQQQPRYAARQPPYVPPIRRGRTIADFDAPTRYAPERSAIRLQQPLGRDFEIKPQIITLVKQNQFHGLPSEHPMDHIDTFEEICSTTRASGVTNDSLRLKLFPFSLADKAHKWLKSMPPGSITTWEGCKEAFLTKFYTKSRLNQVRNKMQSFQQGPVESFFEAWERFKDYERDCPHHGFPDGNLLTTFYRGLHPKYQLSLDTASNGDFTTKTVEEGRVLIENLAVSNDNSSNDFDRTTRPNNSESKQIAELKKMMDSLLRSQQRDVNACDNTLGNGEAFEDYDPCGQEEEVNYVGSQGFYQNRGYNGGFNNNFRNALSYRNPNVENPQDQIYPNNKQFQNRGSQNANFGGNNFQSRPQYNNARPPYPALPAIMPAPQEGRIETMFQQLMNSQDKLAKDVNAKVDFGHRELNVKIEGITSHMRKLEVQVAQTADAVRRQQGALPGRPEDNPKGYCNAISAYNTDEKNKPTDIVPLFDSHEDVVRITRDAAERQLRRPLLRRLAKAEDPGRFVFRCSITGIEFPDSLCDSGANVNVMSREVAEKIGLRNLCQSNMSLVFGDSSQKTPDGMVHNLQLVVGNCIVPTDFHVLKMDKRVERPLILGRPFLATVGAVLDHADRKMTFKYVDRKIRHSQKLEERLTPMDRFSPREVDKGKAIAIPDEDKKAKAKPKSPKYQFWKARIIVPPDLKGKTEQVQEMVDHTKQLLLQTKSLGDSKKGELVTEKPNMLQAKEATGKSRTAATDSESS